MQSLYVLYEAASGYALFEAIGLDEIGQSADAVQQSVSDLERFGKVVKLTAFKPFNSAADALEQCNAVSEGEVLIPWSLFCPEYRWHLPSGMLFEIVQYCPVARQGMV